jgi:DNA-binding transcriptional regulator WhiA
VKRASNMGSTCSNVEHMSKMIQIRNVPDDLHRALKVRAAERDMSLSDYLLSELEGLVGKPTLAELMERIMEREPVEYDESAADIIRRQRGPIP